MKINILASAIAMGGLAVTGAASAQIVGGTVGGALSGSATGPGVTVPSVGTPPIATPPSTSTPPVVPPNASARGQAATSANANAGPVSATAGASLDTLAAGMAVQDASGRAVGKVTQVLRTKEGKIHSVTVDRAGKTVNLAPGTLSVSGNVVTTTEADADAR